MEKVIVANQKMNMSYHEVKKFINGLSKASFKSIICPSSLYVPYYVEKGITTGIQNIYTEKSGPYTGEISAYQAKSVGAQYVLIGHSERRRIFGETDDDVNLKVKQSLEAGLKVILCVGENIGEDYKEVIKRQITLGLKDVSSKVIISYEPVYSIGTGIIPSNDEIIEVVKFIKSFFDYDVDVFYGGSVNLDTALELKKIDLLSGYLVGSLSTDIDDFIKIGEVLG